MPRSSGTLRAIRRQGQQGRVRSQLQGVASVRKLIRQLPASVKAEMADTLSDVAPDYLAAVQADTPVAAAQHRRGYQPGDLRRAIAAKVLRSSLRLRVGLLGKRVLSDFFYGRIVEFGRKAQVVNVTRKAGVKPYKMKVRAMAPRHFVYAARPELRNRLRNRLNTFWDHALAHASAGGDIDA